VLRFTADFLPTLLVALSCKQVAGHTAPPPPINTLTVIPVSTTCTQTLDASAEP
jgi:hypothetical protein